jgi:hypothetical protein
MTSTHGISTRYECGELMTLLLTWVKYGISLPRLCSAPPELHVREVIPLEIEIQAEPGNFEDIAV